MNEEQISVAGLIEQLQKFPPDAMVLSEGCDCTEAADGAEYDPEKNEVTITRAQ